MIELKGISKAFGGVAALDGVSLLVRAGEVHGLLGENGAGKSTLMNILFGLVQPDAGEIQVEGKRANIGGPRDAQLLGMGMVHQHFKLAPTMSVVDNLGLALGKGLGGIGRGALAKRLAELGGLLHWKMDPDAIVGRLSVGEQQRVEIVKALATGARALILDEPTAVLTPAEVDELLPAVRALAARGTAVVFISHKLHEVKRVCDAVSVLRRGTLVFSGKADELSAEGLAERMIGKKVELPRSDGGGGGVHVAAGPVRLELKGVTVKERGATVLENVSMVVRGGEIVGIAGVDGNGQTPLAGVIVGTVVPSAGEVRLEGKPTAGTSIRRRTERMGVIPEDRQKQALVMPLGVTENLVLKQYREKALSWMGWVRRGAWRGWARERVERFDVRPRSVFMPVAALSGGNQQKVVVARELGEGNEGVVLAVNPTRGLDVGATAFVMGELLAARARGAAVVLIHSDLDELLRISDRVLVMFNGTLRESGWPGVEAAAIGRMMLGVGSN